LERKAGKKIEFGFMENKTKKTLPDLMKEKDKRNVAIDRVGISELKVPLRFKKPNGKIYSTVGKFEMYVNLNSDERGTHMSRFSILLNDFLSNEDNCLDSESIESLTREMKKYLESSEAFINVEFDYFREVKAPVTSIVGVAPYSVGYKSSFDKDDKFSLKTWVKVTGQTCCPCSKEISDYDPNSGKGKGAHSQHGHIFIEVENMQNKNVSLGSLIDLAEKSLSAPSYPILKRQDEREATISAYENPCFVEDVIRGCATRLRKMGNIRGFSVEVVNDEVIHFHKAKAFLQENLN